jgi:glycosyltransferase involved in cell wall biosynthesis
MKKKLIVFHPAIAPYRVDFFNSIDEIFDAKFYFEFDNALEQTFDQKRLQEYLSFIPKYLSPGFLGIKNLRFDVLSILWKNKADVVFISEYNLLGLLVCLFKILVNWRLKIVTVCDDNVKMAQNASWVKRIMRYVMLHILSAVILADPKSMEWYGTSLKYKAKYCYFPIIQSDAIFRERLKQALPLSVSLTKKYDLIGKKVILYVGRLVEVKNVSLLLKAFHDVIGKSPEARLFIVGDGELQAELKRQIRGYIYMHSVQFVGKQEGLDLFAYYNIAQIFVLPSIYEPFGTVINEALLAGCYTLCSSAAGSAFLIKPHRNGDLFDPDSNTELGEKLLFSIRHCEGVKDVLLKENNMYHSYDQYITSLFNQLNSIIN